MTETKTIAFLTNIVPPYRVEFFRALSTRWGRVVVIRSQPSEPNRSWSSKEMQYEDVITLRSLTVRSRRRVLNQYDEEQFLHLPLNSLSALIELRPDVVVAGEAGPRTLAAVLYRRLFGRDCRLVVHMDVSEWTEQGRSQLRERLRGHLLRHADLVLVNGSSGARYVERLLSGVGSPPKPIEALPYPVPSEFYRLEDRTDSSSGGKRLLYVGQIIERKNVLQMLQELVRVANSGSGSRIEFGLVGGTIGQEFIDSTFKACPSLSIRQHGAVSYEELPSLYSKYDMLVLPSLAETWGMVVGEALASGMPVIGSVRAQAVDELVVDGWNGWRFDPLDSQGLRRALETALSIPTDVLQGLKLNCHTSALRLQPHEVAHKLTGLLESL